MHNYYAVDIFLGLMNVKMKRKQSLPSGEKDKQMTQYSWFNDTTCLACKLSIHVAQIHSLG